jgi:hypothetical protein
LKKIPKSSRRRPPKKIRRRAQSAHTRAPTGDDIVDAFGPLHPFKLYRTNMLARLFGVDRSTIWRLRQRHALPEFKSIGGIEGLTGAQLARLLAEPSAVVAAVEEERDNG